MTPSLISPTDSLPMGITLHFSTNHETKQWSHTGERGTWGPAVTMVMQVHHSHLGSPCLNSRQQDFFFLRIVIQSLHRSKTSLYSSV